MIANLALCTIVGNVRVTGGVPFMSDMLQLVVTSQILIRRLHSAT